MPASKPFSAGGNSGGSTDIEFGDIKVDPDRREVTVLGQPLDLAQRVRFTVVFSGQSTPCAASGNHCRTPVAATGPINQIDNFNFIYSHVKNLRKKLLVQGCADYIRMVYGIGYKFTDRKPWWKLLQRTQRLFLQVAAPVFVLAGVAMFFALEWSASTFRRRKNAQCQARHRSLRNAARYPAYLFPKYRPPSLCCATTYRNNSANYIC